MLDLVLAVVSIVSIAYALYLETTCYKQSAIDKALFTGYYEACRQYTDMDDEEIMKAYIETAQKKRNE